MTRRTLVYVFTILTVINVLIFLNRQHFEYKPYTPPGELYGYCDDECIEKWEDYMDDFPKEELKSAKNILDTVISPTETNSTRQILLISDFLRRHFSNRGGLPSDSLLAKHPVAQFYSLLENNNEKIWCGNWSNIFAYFCWARKIPNRIIEIMKPGDHHVLNECYIREDSAWALVDLTNNIILPRDNEGNYHTVISYIKKENTGNYQSGYPVYYYNRYNLKMVYSSASRLKRYITPDPWYQIVDPQNSGPGNLLFYIKIVLFYIWVILAMIFFISVARKRFRPAN